jgi:outer membrane protein TolC
VAALLLVPGLAFGQERLTLDDAVSLALTGSRQVKVAELEIRKKEAQVAAARTYRAPQFRVDLAALQQVTDAAFLFPTGAFGTFEQIGPVPPAPARLPLGRDPAFLVFGSVSQPISQLHRIGLGIDLAGTEVALAQEMARQQQQVIVNEIRKTYYSLLQTTTALDATRDAVRAYQETVRVATDAVAQQAILQGDLLDAQAGLAKSELDEVTLSNALATLKERLNGFLGRDQLTDFTPVLPEGEDPAQLDLQVARARAVENRPEIRQAAIKVQQAELDRRMKKAEFIPDLSVAFLYLSPFNVDIVPTNMAGAGVTLSWDVFDWGRKKNELVAKDTVIEQARLGAEEARSQVFVDVGHAFRRYQEARAQLRVAEIARDAGAERVRVATNQHTEQAIQLKDLLQAQARGAEARYKYREALVGYWTARADLERAMGER